MSNQERTEQIAVDLLRAGLHVTALDRPWVETPFIFQGFRIQSQDEIDTLRAYCSFVEVDIGQSEPTAAGALMSARKRQPIHSEKLGSSTQQSLANRPLPEALQRCAGALYEPVAHPDRGRFTRLVQAAGKTRNSGTEAVREALLAMHRDKRINIGPATRAVDNMTRLIREDATASLWLSRLRNHQGYLADHAVNTCAIALAFGAYLGMEGKPLQCLGIAALLMDVGMVKVPREILAKKRPLSSKERETVRQHVQQGCEQLEKAGVPAEALAIVRAHHERIDGRGYPNQVGGDELPRQALIAGLADSFEAMTSDRPYRTAFRPDQALQELYRNAEDTFGTDLVESFIRCVGTYPVGTLVQLDNNATGLVVGSKPGAGASPTVLMLRTPDGQPYRKRLLLNLAASDDRNNRQIPAHMVRRALGQREANVNVGKVVAREFGLEAVMAPSGGGGGSGTDGRARAAARA